MNPLIAAILMPLSSAATIGIGGALEAAGYCPGVVNKSGMWVKSAPWAASGSLDYRDPAFTVLRNRKIDAAVVERTIEKVLDYGIGSGGCDISVVLDSSPASIVTDLWPTGIGASEGTKLLMRSARKACIALVDNGLVDSLAAGIPASKLYVLSLTGWTDSIEKHVTNGAAALALENISGTYLTVRVSTHAAKTATASIDIPARLGDTSESGLLTSLAALGVLMSLGHSVEEAAGFLTSSSWANAS